MEPETTQPAPPVTGDQTIIGIKAAPLMDEPSGSGAQATSPLLFLEFRALQPPCQEPLHSLIGARTPSGPCCLLGKDAYLSLQGGRGTEVSAGGQDEETC